MFRCPFFADGYQAYRLNNESYVRVLHASPGSPAVDVYVNNRRIVRNLSYKQFSEYLPLAAGTYNIKLVPADKTEPVIISTNYVLPANSIFTIAAIGKLPEISLYPILEPTLPKRPDKEYIRFVHLSPDAPNVDLTEGDGTTLFKNVPYKGITQYKAVDPGLYTFNIMETNTNKRVLYVPNIRLSGGKFYTVYAVGLVGNEPKLQVLIPLDGNSYINVYQ